MSYFCNQCGGILQGPHQECPKCHSRYVEISDAIGVCESSEWKKKDKRKYNGKHRYYETGCLRKEKCRSQQCMAERLKIENRAEDTYTERVTLLDGTVIHEAHEPLHDHQNHGSAKEKKDKQP